MTMLLGVKSHSESVRGKGDHFTRDIIVGCPCVLYNQKVYLVTKRLTILVFRRNDRLNLVGRSDAPSFEAIELKSIPYKHT